MICKCMPRKSKLLSRKHCVRSGASNVMRHRLIISRFRHGSSRQVWQDWLWWSQKLFPEFLKSLRAHVLEKPSCVCSLNLARCRSSQMCHAIQKHHATSSRDLKCHCFFAWRFIGGTEFYRSERPYCRLTNQHMESTVSSWSKNIGAFLPSSMGHISN